MKRKFPPGSEWLYLKIYTGIKTADLVLEDIIQPFVDYFQQKEYISKWFFIRYNDPKPHLRIRLLLNSFTFYNEILEKINQSFEQFVNSGEIETIQIDTYNREIERYGNTVMEEAESLFHKNSEFTLQCLHFEDEEKIMVSLFYIDKILNKLGLSILEKHLWIKRFNDAFKTEFNADKKLNSGLDKKYRAFKPKYTAFLQSDEFSETRDFIFSHIEEKDPVLKEIILRSNNLSSAIPLHEFFQSIFHMNINRLFVSQQRVFEMVIYDYLMRYYKSVSNNQGIVIMKT
ncbi:thiopeptide-type bacteriocin biosynthesis protein [Chryseobacterium salviniae]|uniref:Thiopeptide-type bacteriocin biosynthesis protein n=1 Tax=Chryseobacterium salviniae TaxID=3101750 RepID=A0ABU6HYD0_9FLAO|nr:thiopeptide-type bacteriocin biosynthesis protein [Chryseobacterium sp. T9W2-O]MEC3877799.1 thiopeptide-type bacteriocin biosynthesis protein [Chryseobacterium sp. T9W2-O]